MPSRAPEVVASVPAAQITAQNPAAAQEARQAENAPTVIARGILPPAPVPAQASILQFTLTTEEGSPPPLVASDPPVPTPTERSNALPSLLSGSEPVFLTGQFRAGFVKSARAGSMNELVSVAALMIAAEQPPPASAPAAGP